MAGAETAVIGASLVGFCQSPAAAMGRFWTLPVPKIGHPPPDGSGKIAMLWAGFGKDNFFILFMDSCLYTAQTDGADAGGSMENFFCDFLGSSLIIWEYRGQSHAP